MDLTTHLRDDGTGLLVLSGEVDVECADRVRDAGIRLLASDGCHQLVVDLLDVTFIDSCGVGALIAIRNQVDRSSQKLVLHRPQERVQRVLDVTGLADVFLIEDR